MDKLIYIRGESEPTRESAKIEFEFTSDLEIKEFKQLCVRMASALGYQPATIIGAFGEDSLDKDQNDKNQTKLLFD